MQKMFSKCMNKREDNGTGQHTLTLTHNCVDDLEDTDGKGSCFTSTRLCLCNSVAAFADLDNRSGLYC